MVFNHIANAIARCVVIKNCNLYPTIREWVSTNLLTLGFLIYAIRKITWLKEAIPPTEKVDTICLLLIIGLLVAHFLYKILAS